MSSPPIVGTVFKLEKVCATHGTAVGMHAVIVAYTRNDSKDRMEVEVDVLGSMESRMLLTLVLTIAVPPRLSRNHRPSVLLSPEGLTSR